MTNVIFVCVAFNNYDDTKIFCQSLFDQIYSDKLKCYIVDNSSDNSISHKLKILEKEYKFVSVLPTSKNLGYFGAFNYFFEVIGYPKENEYLIICNNDLKFDNKFVNNLLSNDYSNEIFAVCPDVVTVDGYHQNPHVIKPLSLIARLKLDLYYSNYYIGIFMYFIFNILNLSKLKVRGNYYSNPMYLHMGIGACYILTSSFFKKIKKLYYPYFLYGEEAFLSNQIHNTGGSLYYDPSLVVEHKESATLSKIPKKLTYQYAREGYCEYRKLY